MAEYTWRAARSDGALVDGRLEAASRTLALRRLRAQGYTPIRVDESDGPARSAAEPPGAARSTWRFARPGATRGPDRRDVQAFTAELAVTLHAGIPLDRALRVLAGMARKDAMRALLEDLLRAVKAGKGLSQALAAHQALFGEFYVNMVRAGEAGGRLAEVLSRLAEHMERMRALREGVLSALLYPALLVTVALISIVLMLVFVIPQFEALFADMGEALPLATRVIVAAGRGTAEWGWLLALVLAGGGLALGRWLATPAGRRWRDGRLLALPVFGAMVQKFEITRFARSLGTLLASGVPIVGAIRIASDTLGNVRLRTALAGVTPAIRQGGRLADALAATGLFTPLALDMVRLGEETGRLDELLLELARIHDAEVQAAIKRALGLLEPLLILVLGGVIGLLVVSLLAGVLSISELAG